MSQDNFLIFCNMNLNNITSNEKIDLTQVSFSQPRRNLMFSDAKSTIPIGIEILEKDLNKTTITLKNGKLSIVPLRVYVPLEKEESLKKWVCDFEERFNVKVIIQRQSGYKGIQNLFSTYFHDTMLLTNEHIEKIKKIFDAYFGIPPKINESYIREMKSLNSNIPDLTHIPFIAIDSEGTLDPEDAFYAKRISTDIYQLTIAIADISWLIEPRGRQKDFAINLGATIYGSKSRLSVLGNLANFECSHLSSTKKSPAWILELEVNKAKRVKLTKDPFLANVKIHEQITPENANSLEDIKIIMEIGYILKSQRLGAPQFNNADNTCDLNVNLLLSEIIIKSKEIFANFLSKNKPKKAIFKVQRLLSLQKKKEIIRNLNKIGIPATSEIFKTPILLMEILSQLQEMNFNSRIFRKQDINESEKILNDLLNVFLKRSYYENKNRGHAFLKVLSYCDMKGRLSAGIINQIQARSILQDKTRGYSAVEIKKMVNKINRQMKNYGVRFYTFRFLEMLTSKLSLIGTPFLGTITQIKGDHALIEVETFKKWGVLPTSPDFTIGKSVKVNLLGFLLKKQRFLFEEIK